jgi:hypothetical protein
MILLFKTKETAPKMNAVLISVYLYYSASNPAIIASISSSEAKSNFAVANCIPSASEPRVNFTSSPTIDKFND